MVQSHSIPIYFNFSVSNLNHIVSIGLLEEIICLSPFIYVHIVSNFREIMERFLRVWIDFRFWLLANMFQNLLHLGKKWTVITYCISKLFPIFFQDLEIDLWKVIFLKICHIDISYMFMLWVNKSPNGLYF